MKTYVKSSVFILLAIALLVLSGMQSRHLRTFRHTNMQRISVTYSAEVPPLVTFTSIALGGFRGVIADALWIRVAKLQDERRFVELVQLSDWITKLEPHIAEVWVFHAWNMAYNVGVLLSRPEDRWRWVINGIKLLRDEGIVINPRNATIYRELGWMFQHKIGMDADNDSSYYRTEWVKEIAPYLNFDGSLKMSDDPATHKLESIFKLNVDEMKKLENRFGKIDWRVPAAHSLYWATLGLNTAGPNEQLNCRRMIYGSLMEMCYGKGNIVGDAFDENFTFNARPNTGLIQATLVFFEETMRLHDFIGVKYAYMGFLCNAIKIRSIEGNTQEANDIYSTLKAFFGDVDSELFPTVSDILEDKNLDTLEAHLNEMRFKNKESQKE